MLEGRAHQARRLPVRALPGAVDVIGGEDGDRSNVLLKKFVRYIRPDEFVDIL